MKMFAGGPQDIADAADVLKAATGLARSGLVSAAVWTRNRRLVRGAASKKTSRKQAAFGWVKGHVTG